MKRYLAHAALATLILSGCLGGGGNATGPTAGQPTSAPTATPSQTPMEPSDVFLNVQNSQAEGDFTGALSDVVTSTCAADGATWVGAGTVQNSSDARVDYRIWVSFLDPSGGTLGLVQSNVNGVRAGDKGDYTAAMPYTAADALTCVLRVERRPAK